MRQQVRGDAPEGLRGVAAGSVRREDDEVDLLPLSDLEEGLTPVRPAHDDGANGGSVPGQLVAEVIQVGCGA